MRSNDDLLSVQEIAGTTIYTLVDSEGYLVREDIHGERQRYPLTGGGGQEVDPIFTSLSGNFATSGQIAELSGIVGQANETLEAL